MPDTEDPAIGCAVLLSEALTLLHAFGARVLHESLADKSHSFCVGESSPWDDDFATYDSPRAAAAFAL